MTQSGDRIPPQALDAEAAVLSAILLDATALDRVQDELGDHHFFAKANARIYEAMCALRLGGFPADIVLVSNWLRDRNRLAEVGGTPYIAQISDMTPAVANVEEHARIIVAKWRLRQMIAIAQAAVAQGYAPVDNPQLLLETVEQQLAEVTHQGQRVREEAVRTIAGRIITRISNARARGEAVTGIRTGFAALDRMTGGLFESDLVVVAARPGLGKAQPLGAKVLTPNGWRRMGDLMLGDLVIGADGHSTVVTGIFDRGELAVFRVELDDGGETECCAEHLWYTRTRKNRRQHEVGTVKSLSEIMASMYRGDTGLNHSLPFVAPVEFASSELPLHPYFIGVFLGDGCATETSVVISNPEPDVQRAVCRVVAPGDVGWVSDEGKTIRVRRAQRNNLRSGTRLSLESLGLAGKRAEEKFIPEQYLRGSVAERLSLLRGICDTDGYVVNGNKGIEHVTVSCRLRDDLLTLVGSLGGRWSSVEKPAHYFKNGERHATQLAYRTVFFLPNGLCPVSSKKHLAKWDHGRHRLAERFVKSVTPAGRKVCRCISVASADGLYVTDDFIVTHNTAFVQSLACNVARPRHLANGTTQLGHAALFCTLEQPREQLVMRIASHEAEFDARIWRRPRVTEEDWRKISGSFAHLEHLPLYIDDTPALTLGDLRAKVRRLKRQIERTMADGTALVRSKPLKLVIVDYLQLMKGLREKGDTREREVSSLSAGLKTLAKQEGLVVIAVSQLNRELEKQKDRRPQLKDLRECLAGDTRLYDPDTGLRESVGALWARGVREVKIVALNQRTLKLEARAAVLKRGAVKPVATVRTRTGRTIRLTPDHPALTIFGWRPIADSVGTEIAVPRVLPGPANSEADPPEERARLLGIGIHGHGTTEKAIPEIVMRAGTSAVRAFLGGLYAGDGSVVPRKAGGYVVKYTSTSMGLLDQMRHLLLRLGIIAQLERPTRHTKSTVDIATLRVEGKEQVGAFAGALVIPGVKGERLRLAAEWARSGETNHHLDRLPAAVGAAVNALRRACGLSHAALGYRVQGKRIDRQHLAEVAVRCHAAARFPAEREDAEKLAVLAASDVFWDRVEAVTVGAPEQTYDLVVPDHHCFVAEDGIWHNSGAIEQDADNIYFLYRESYYDRHTNEKLSAELDIAKQRNGPTGMLDLIFRAEYTRYYNAANEVGEEFEDWFDDYNDR